MKVLCSQEFLIPHRWGSSPLRSLRGFDHGVGHPLLLLYDAKALSGRKNKAFKGLGHYAEWPKVADAVIKALQSKAKHLVFVYEAGPCGYWL